MVLILLRNLSLPGHSSLTPTQIHGTVSSRITFINNCWGQNDRLVKYVGALHELVAATQRSSSTPTMSRCRSIE